MKVDIRLRLVRLVKVMNMVPGVVVEKSGPNNVIGPE